MRLQGSAPIADNWDKAEMMPTLGDVCFWSDIPQCLLLTQSGDSHRRPHMRWACVAPLKLNLIEQKNPSDANSCCILPETAFTQALANWLPKPSLLGKSILGPPISFHCKTTAPPSSCHLTKTRPLSRDREPYFAAFV